MLTKNINNNMSKKFLKLVESIHKGTNGGFLTGQCVVLAPKYKSVPDYKNLSDAVKQQIEDLFKSGNPVTIVGMNTKMPSSAPGNADNRGLEFVAIVAELLNSGLHNPNTEVALPSNCLMSPEEDEEFGHKVPDSWKYNNKVQIDPIEAEENEEQQQTMTQQGDSLKKTNLSNARKNTKIPSKSATPSPAVNENYTSQYMPING